MTNNRGLTVVDLFCGAGGYSLGFHQAGFDVVLGVDNWNPACDTHFLNGIGATQNIDLFDMDVNRVLALKKEVEDKYGPIDVLIGSPPCTEFSYAKNGGKGDIEKGMILVRRNLLFVTIFKPKYWVMENVPRLESALSKECSGSKETGWTIPYEKLGVPRSRFKELGLVGDSLHIPHGEVLIASDYGAHQNRKRFIAGNYPIHELEKVKTPPGTDVSLDGLIVSLQKNLDYPDENGYSKDPNYPHHKVRKKDIKDHNYDTSLHPMYWEEMRHYKRRHIQYGRMHLPENPKAPARTIMATYNTSSRESLILKTNKMMLYQGKIREIYRQPTVREVGCIQGFPLDFQLVANRLSDRYKLVGNAVPCQLSFAIAKSIARDIEKKLSTVTDNDFYKRAISTLSRLHDNSDLPIIATPSKTVNEAIDIGPINKKFKAKFTKHIRRKLLSATLQGDSYTLIFENMSISEGKICGGPYWKSCIQKGVGKKFYRIYLDEIAVNQLLKAMDADFNVVELKRVCKSVVDEVEKGIPLVKTEWNEFPGWFKNIEKTMQAISETRLKIPSVSLFQKAFTEEVKDLGEYIGPIDFFDGLDAILLNIFSKKEHKHLIKNYLQVVVLNDSDNHPYRMDPRIVTQIRNTKIPLVTATAALLSILILNKMYINDEKVEKNAYVTSLFQSRAMIIDWCR